MCLLQGVEIERLTDALGKYQAKLWSLDKSQGNIGSFEQQIKELTEEIDRQSKQFDK